RAMTSAKISPARWPSPPRFLRGEMATGIPAPPGSGTSILICAPAEAGALSPITDARITPHNTCPSPRPGLLTTSLRALPSAKSELDFLRGEFLLVGLWGRGQGVGFTDRSHHRFIEGTIPRPLHQFDGEHLSVRLHAETHGGGQPGFFLGDDPTLFDP